MADAMRRSAGGGADRPAHHPAEPDVQFPAGVAALGGDPSLAEPISLRNIPIFFEMLLRGAVSNIRTSATASSGA